MKHKCHDCIHRFCMYTKSDLESRLSYELEYMTASDLFTIEVIHALKWRD